MHAETKMSKVWTLPHIHWARARAPHTDLPTERHPTETNSPRFPPLPVWLLLVLLLLLWHALKSSQVSAVSHWIYWNFPFALRHSLGRCRWPVPSPAGFSWPSSVWMRLQNISVVFFPNPLVAPPLNNSVNVSLACGWQRSAVSERPAPPSSANLNIRWASIFYYVQRRGCWEIFRP